MLFADLVLIKFLHLLSVDSDKVVVQLPLGHPTFFTQFILFEEEKLALIR